MKITEIISESDSYQPPQLNIGDKILKGKFKNSPAEIKGFKKDKHNQPVLKTNKGDVQLFKPRITKLMSESNLYEDRDSMLAHIHSHCPAWGIDEFKNAFEKLCAHPEISDEWKEQMHELLLKTAETYKQPIWNNEFKNDPDKSSLLGEYAELADQIRTWYALRK